MQIKKHWLVVIILVMAILPLAACGKSDSGSDGYTEPYEKEEIAGSEFSKITLTEKAAERLGVQSTEVIEEDVDGEMKMVIPYAAVLYGLNGETWAYTRNPHPESLSFVRVPISVERIDGGRAILSESLDPDTHVVTIGAAELYGAETGVGK